MIMESNSTSEKVKETRKTIEELRHQLADIDSEDVISSKISEVLFHYFYCYGPYNVVYCNGFPSLLLFILYLQFISI